MPLRENTFTTKSTRQNSLTDWSTGLLALYVFRAMISSQLAIALIPSVVVSSFPNQVREP